jgi:hypothetical protein
LEAVFVRLSWNDINEQGGNLRALSAELSARKLARESREAGLRVTFLFSPE